MNCSKCGYAIPLGQAHCVYCGTAAPKYEKPVVQKTSAFARQINASQSDAKAESSSPAAQPEVRKSAPHPVSGAFTQKPAGASATQQISSPFTQPAISKSVPPVAPYARRPMYSAFDPNSADSPFVRKTVSELPEEQPENATVVQSETAPETQPVQAEIQKTEEQPAEKATADEAAAGEGTHKKKPGLSTVALTLVFVAMVVCWFINF